MGGRGGRDGREGVEGDRGKRVKCSDYRNESVRRALVRA